MKKTLLFILVGLFSFQSFGQDPDLFDTWYLQSISIDLGDEYIVSEIDPPITPTLTISETLAFSGEGACNTFTGTFTNDIPGILSSIVFNPTNSDCGIPLHNNFEDSYFDAFNYENTLDFTLTVYATGLKILHLSDPLMSNWVFSNVNFPEPYLFQTWYLSSIEFDLGESLLVSEITPVISPDLIINTSFEFYGNGACNSFIGTFVNNENENIILPTNYDQTLLTCNYQEHINFEGAYFPFFSDETPLTYNIGRDYGGYYYLTLEANPGFVLIFQDSPLLATPNFSLTDLKIYPNPVSDQLFISSENIVIETISIYSISGKRILVEKNESNSIDVSSFSKGIYFIELSSSEGKSIKKFIKN